MLPDTPSTRNIIDEKVLSELPKSCVIINGGRGTAIDEHALINGLHTQQIKAAVLDVFTGEPLAKDHPFYDTQNLYITNHTAATSYPENVFPIFSKNLARINAGRELEYKLDFEKGY